MTGPTPSKRHDWVTPAVLVAIVVVVGVAVALLAVRANSRDTDSAAGQFESWSRCLRSEGVPVPLVESLGNGSFRITVDGSLLGGGADLLSAGDAMAACRRDVPERVAGLVDIFQMLDGLPFGDGAFGDMNDLMDPGFVGPDGIGPLPPQVGPDVLKELCDRLDEHLNMGRRVVPRLQRACQLGA